MDETHIDDISQVVETENEILTQSFSAKVKYVIFQIKHNSATGLDGFPREFY
jgi:hypothetical protein